MNTEVNIDPEIKELVPGFLTSRKTDLEEIQRLISQQDFERIARICHNIKGIAAPYGYPSLEVMAKGMEAASRSNDLQAIVGFAEKMAQYLSRFAGVTQ